MSRKEYFKDYYQKNKDTIKAKQEIRNKNRINQNRGNDSNKIKYELTILDGNDSSKCLFKRVFSSQIDICNELNMKPYQVSRIYRGEWKHPNYSIKKVVG